MSVHPIEVVGLAKVFGLKIILQDVSLHVAAGSIVGLVVNGSGKSTLIKCMLGLLRASGRASAHSR